MFFLIELDSVSSLGDISVDNKLRFKRLYFLLNIILNYIHVIDFGAHIWVSLVFCCEKFMTLLSKHVYIYSDHLKK